MPELTRRNRKSALENQNPCAIFHPMISAQSGTANRNSRAAAALVAFLILGILSGCGGGWQPDGPDPTRPPAAEGSGVYSPSTEDSRISL